MRWIALIAAILVVGGCTQSAPIYDGQGRRMETVACLDHQTLGGMTECLKKAAELCPAGYYWKGSTNHPIPWQVTEPTPEMKEAFGPHDVASIDAFNRGGFRPIGGYGWQPRITRNRGDYQYITVQCK